MTHTETNANGVSEPRIIRILSNLRRLDGVQTDRFLIVGRHVEEKPTIWSVVRMFFQAFRYDAVVACSETRRLLIFCILRFLVPLQHCRVIAVDYILPKPKTVGEKLSARLKGFFLKRVDAFILHFADMQGYERDYGIPQSRCVFVPFKVNYLERIPPPEQLSSDGEYVFTAGRSFRDIPTFIGAMEQTGYPGLLLHEDPARMRDAGTALDLRQVPLNLKIEKNVGEKSWLDFIARAKIVVVPLLPGSGYAPGLSLYLMAMAMKKCVIITEGLATRGMITDQAIVVPPLNVQAMADAIRLIWKDEKLREKIAADGQRYAMELGGEARLLRDIANVSGTLVESN